MHLQQQSSQEDSAAERYEKSRRKFFERIEGRSMCSIKQIEDLASAALEPFDAIKSSTAASQNVNHEVNHRGNKLSVLHSNSGSSCSNLPILGEELTGYRRFLSPCEPLMPWTTTTMTCDNIGHGLRQQQTLLIENHNYASIVSKRRFESTSDEQRNDEDDLDEEYNENLQPTMSQSYDASIIMEKDDLSLRDYVNLPPDQNLKLQQQPIVEYATVRSTMISNDHDHHNAHNHNHKRTQPTQQNHDHYQKPQRHFAGSTSDVSFGEQSCSSSSNNSAKSGGFSMLPPIVRPPVDCSSENKFESLVSPKLANEESGCGGGSRSTKSTTTTAPAASTSSLFKRFGSLVSKAFTATNAIQTQAPTTSSSLVSTSNSTAGANLPATSKISDQEQQALRELGNEEKILHLNQENNNHVVGPAEAAASFHEEKPPEEVNVKSALVIECTSADQVLGQRQRQWRQRQREPLMRRHELPLLGEKLDEADLVILPSKCVNQRTKPLQAAVGKVQSQPQKQSKQELHQITLAAAATNPIKSCRINGKLSRDNRERASRARNRAAHRRPQKQQVIDLSSSSSGSITSSSISISSASRSCATSSDSGHNRTTDSSRPLKSSSLSEELESLMSKSSGASNGSPSRQDCRRRHHRRQLARSLTIQTKVPLAEPSANSASSSVSKRRPMSVADHIDCGTSAGSDSGNSKSKGDLEEMEPLKLSKNSSLMHLVNSASPTSLRTIESTPDLTTAVSAAETPNGSRDSATNCSDHQPAVNGRKDEESKTLRRSGKSIKLQSKSQTQPMSGFWGLASLMETSHASGNVTPLDHGDKNGNSKTTATQRQAKLTGGGVEVKNRTNLLVEKRKLSSKKHGGGGHELLMNDYSNDSLEPQQEQHQQPKQQVAAGYTLYSSLALPQMDKDLKANGKCQSLNLYQNLLRNYVKRSHKNSATTATGGNAATAHNRHNCHHRHSNHNHHHHHGHSHNHHNHGHSTQHHTRHTGGRGHEHRGHRSSSRGHAHQQLQQRARSCSSCNCSSADSLSGSASLSGKAHVWGQLIKINKSDGSQVVELHRAAGKSWGFFVARGTINNSRGIFISRMHDALTSGALTGLLSIGDCILAIDDCVIGQDYDILRVNQMISKKSKILLRVKPFKG